MDLFYAGSDKLGKTRTYEYLFGRNKLFSYEFINFNRYFLSDYFERKLLCSYILQGLDGVVQMDTFSTTGYNRLMSYENDKSRANKLTEVKKLMEIYMAGDTSGFDEIRPEQIISDFNVLLSYGHPKGKDSVNKVIEEKIKEDADAIISSRSRKREYNAGGSKRIKFSFF